MIQISYKIIYVGRYAMEALLRGDMTKISSDICYNKFADLPEPGTILYLTSDSVDTRCVAVKVKFTYPGCELKQTVRLVDPVSVTRSIHDVRKEISMEDTIPEAIDNRIAELFRLRDSIITTIQHRLDALEKKPSVCNPNCAFIMEFRHLERREDRSLKAKATIFEKLGEVREQIDVLVEDQGKKDWFSAGQLLEYNKHVLRGLRRKIEMIQLLCDMGDPEDTLLRQEAEKEGR